jgi:cell division control protein 45
MCVVKDGPDVTLFTHPAALTKLALWIGEAIAEQEKEAKGKLGHGGRGTPLVVAGLNENRGVYVVVGTGGGGGGIQGFGFGDKGAANERKRKREEKEKLREERRRNKEKIREEKREARRRARGDEEDEEDEDEETESEGSESESEEEEEDEDEEEKNSKGFGRNKFGNAFQEVVEETNARVRIDSFEHCVVEVKKEDLGGFLESLSLKAVVG